MAWVPTPEELAARIKARDRARELRDAGATLAAVADVLTAEGHQTKSGKPWHREGVRRLLAPWAEAWEAPEVEPDWRMGSEGRAEYGRLHLRNRRTRGPANLQKCAHCAEHGIDKQARDWAHVHGTDPDDVMNYVPLCKKCHNAYDQPDGTGDKAIGQRRGEQQRAKTHCPQNHEYTPENTYIIKRSGGRTARQCKTCTKTRRKAA